MCTNYEDIFQRNVTPFSETWYICDIIVIKLILVLNLVRVRSSWLGLGTEPPADRSPNRPRIV